MHLTARDQLDLHRALHMTTRAVVHYTDNGSNTIQLSQACSGQPAHGGSTPKLDPLTAPVPSVSALPEPPGSMRHQCAEGTCRPAMHGCRLTQWVPHGAYAKACHAHGGP